MKSKHLTFGILAILIVGIILISGCAQEQPTKPTTTTQPSETPTTKPSTNFMTYENSAYGIRIKYPFDWTKIEQVMVSNVVAFLSPKESSSDIYQENLNVVVEDLSTQVTTLTLDKYTDSAINLLKQIVTDFNLIESSATKLAGNPAHKVTYTGRQGQYTMKWMQVWTIKNNKAYVITYSAELGKYSDFLNIINEMIDSFEII